MRLQIFNRMLLFNLVVSCGFYRMKLFFFLDRILIRKLISLLLFLKMAVGFSTLKGISIIPLRLGEHLSKRSRENGGTRQWGGEQRHTVSGTRHHIELMESQWHRDQIKGCAGLDSSTRRHGLGRSTRGLTPPAAPGR